MFDDVDDRSIHGIKILLCLKMTSRDSLFNPSSFSDLKVSCNQLTALVVEIKAIYSRFLSRQINSQTASNEIQGLLQEHTENLVTDKTNIVSLFPDSLPFIHINQTYFAPSSRHEHHVNLNITLTPSPSGCHVVILVHPNIVVNDSSADLFDLSTLQYSVRPVFKGRDTTKECLVKEHHVDWSCQQKSAPLHINIHPGDKIIFHARDGLDYTITSANSRYEIPVNPDFDLTLLADHQAEVILNRPGDHYFVSRPHKKHLQLYVHVKSCPYH